MHFLFFFFNDTATTEIYTLSLHDALPIYPRLRVAHRFVVTRQRRAHRSPRDAVARLRETHERRSEEHTSELQSPCNLVCRLLLEKKNPSRCRPARPSRPRRRPRARTGSPR